MVADALAPTRSRAESLIRAGRVLVDDVLSTKPGTRVADAARVRVRGETRAFASRGGEKLAGALRDLDLDPTGLACLDIGAAHGGFTDCLLQAGALRVCCVDVGYGQLDSVLRRDPRVRVLERTNARHLGPGDIEGPVDLITVDVSFISVRLLLPALHALAPAARILVMVKPQFEVGKGQVGKGGVVRDPELRAQAVAGVVEAAAQLGYEQVGQAESRLAGPKGNLEVFVLLEPAAAA